MKHSGMNRLLLMSAAVIAMSCSACNMENWDWFGTKSKKSNDRPVTKARRPADEPSVAAADRAQTPPRGDEKSKEVDDKVDRYVRSMNNSYDPNYEQNDFKAKMRRQNDPNRQSRIKQTAALSREDGAAPSDKPRDDNTAHDTTGLDIEPQSKTSTEPSHSASAKMDDASQPNTTDGLVSPEKKPVPTGPKLDVPPSQVDESEPNGAKSTEPDSKEPSASPQKATDGAAAKPPVLSSIKVSAGPSTTEEPIKSVETEKTTANTPPPAPVVIDTFQKRLEEQEALVGKDPNNVEEQFKLRLMYLGSGHDDKALATTPGVNSEIQDIILAQVKSLIAARSSAQKDPSAWANKQLEAVEDLRNLVRSRADLRVPKVALCRGITAFGQYEPFEPPEFKAGQPNKVALYVEVDNFTAEKTTSGKYRVLLNMRQSLLSKEGQEIWNTKEENIEDMSRQRRRDFFLTAVHIIPKTLAPGEYVYKVEIEDVLAGKINSNTASFKLVP